MENHSSWHAVRLHRIGCQKRAARGDVRLVRSLYAAPRLHSADQAFDSKSHLRQTLASVTYHKW
jgi:hypothetical protein